MSKKIDWANANDSDDEGDHTVHTSQPAPAEVSPVVSHHKEASSSKEISASASDLQVYVGNLPYETDENAIGDFFYSLGCNVTDVKIHRDEKGKSKGNAHVYFGTPESIDIALRTRESDFGGRRIRIDPSSRRERSDRGDRGDRQHDRRGDRGGRDNRNGDRDNRNGDRDNRDNRNGDRDKDRKWERHTEEKRDDQRKDDRRDDRRPNSKGGFRKDGPKSAEQPAPQERRNILINPRTLPLNQIGGVAPGSASIFGEGKARDEALHEKKKDDVVAPTISAVPEPDATSTPVETTTTVEKSPKRNNRKAPKTDGERPAGNRVHDGHDAKPRDNNKGDGKDKKSPRDNSKSTGHNGKPHSTSTKQNKPKTSAPAEVKISEDELNAEKFQKALSKQEKRESQARQNAHNRLGQSTANTFNALSLDDEESDDEN